MMDELKEMLMKELPEEIHDSNMYYELANKAANHCNDRNLAQGLYLISKDEYTHAKFIHDFVVQCGWCIPDDLKCKWETLCDRAHKVYPDVPHQMYDF